MSHNEFDHSGMIGGASGIYGYSDRLAPLSKYPPDDDELYNVRTMLDCIMGGQKKDGETITLRDEYILKSITELYPFDKDRGPVIMRVYNVYNPAKVEEFKKEIRRGEYNA